MKKEKDTMGLKDWAKGKTRLRITLMDKKGNHATFKATKAELDIRTQRIGTLKAIRKDLGLSQSQMAKALRVGTGTLQGWEIGRRAIPETSLTLAQLLHDIPAVRKCLTFNRPIAIIIMTL